MEVFGARFDDDMADEHPVTKSMMVMIGYKTFHFGVLATLLCLKDVPPHSRRARMVALQAEASAACREPVD